MSINDLDLRLAAKISIARQDAGMSEQQAAEQLDISLEEWVLLEAGKARIDASLVSSLAVLFDKPIAWFFDQTVKTVIFPITPRR